MSATPQGTVRFFVRDPDTDAPIPGALIYTFGAGTTTPATTWADAAKAGTLANPIETEADGGVNIFIDGAYKFVIHDAADVLLYEIDDVLGGTDAFVKIASGVVSLPFDDIAATNVQDALEELGQKRVKDTDVIDIAHGGTGQSTAALARDALGVEVGVDVQAFSTSLAALAAAAATVAMFSGMMYGLTTSNAADVTNDITIAAGVCATDDNTDFITLAAPITKRLDANWTVGDNQGGRDTGSIANGTWHVWLIKRPDTGVVDALFSLSATAPTMPNVAYTKKRRVASIVRTGGANKAYTQNGDTFVWGVQAADVSAVNPGTAALTAPLTVPAGIVVNAQVMLSVVDVTPSSLGHYALLTPLAAADTTPSVSAFSLDWGLNGGVVGGAATVHTSVLTDTAAFVRYRLSISNADVTVRLQTVGFIDTRGRMAA